MQQSLQTSHICRQGIAHRAKLAEDLLRENNEIKIIYMPKGLPYLNAVDECRHRVKRALLVLKHCKTKHDMQHSISEYLRTVRHSLDIKKYLARKFEHVLTNF